MSEAAVRDITDETFQAEVLARSHSVPVLVDFWAPWCGPCRMLGPVLERLAPQVADRVEIVRINTEDNQATPAQYQISGIPAVKLFRAGEVVAEFVGAQPEAQVRAFLDRHCPSALDQRVVEGQSALARGELDAAAKALGEVQAARADHPGALLGLAQVAYARGAMDDALALAQRVSPRSDEADQAQHLVELVDLARAGAAGIEATSAASRAAPDDPAARFAYAGALAAASRWSEALDELLALVERDRRWNHEAARKAMLVIFAAVGVQSPVAQAYRRKLAVLL
ncbi:MAG: thioredoxin [Myxococcales bacterium]|nr:thioredoxin [Myxococcales bacterium]